MLKQMKLSYVYKNRNRKNKQNDIDWKSKL